ncbi:MAG: hypothetical protein Q8Q08_12755, partial [Candidatus Omnitrophota bacterium]|nr:hypothetical protein [Candidatus Omnitrophota bacterium]
MLFKDKGLIPAAYHAIRLSTGATPQLRIRLISPDNEWTVSFAPHRIDIDKNAVDPKGDNLGDLAQYCSDATQLFERIIGKYTKRAN